MSGLRRDLSHTLFARKDDFGAVAFELPAAESELEVIDLGDVVLPPASVLHGTVIDESGNAVQGWEVTLRGSNRDRERYRSERDARDAAVDVRVATRTARTDDLGRFAFTDLAMGDYSVEAGLPDSRWRTSASVSLARGASVRDVQLVIRSLDTISGTVRDAEGHAVVGARLTVSAESLRAGTRAYGLTDSSGSFSIHGIPPGTYRIRVVANDVHLAGDASGACNFLAREVGGVSSDERSLAIVLEPAALIRGRVVDADGRGVHDSRVIVRIPGRDDTPGTIAGLDGKFSVAIPVAVSVDVEAYPVSLGCAILPRRPDVPALGGARVSSVVPGDQEVIIRLPR